ncbi:MAG: DNA polymerase I, partial [Burkholderiales bacterium]
MPKPTLLLVDGSSYLYRAFHALPDLRNPDGEPTGAIYGITAMLRRLREDPSLNGGATLGAVVFDAKGKTFRDDMYAEYKANRAEMPEDLVRQVEPIHAIVRALGWPLLCIEGIEADDVIGTLARRASEAGMRTIVITGDKDLAQLVDEDVTLVNTMSRDGGPPERLDREAVLAKFGVPPERIVDYLTLVGDPVDNVPGVQKVGPKTAAKWLGAYESLDGVLAHADEIKGVAGENLREARDWLPTARTLVTVLTDCDLSGHLGSLDGDLQLRERDERSLRALFEHWGFRTWLRELQGAGPAGAVGVDADAALAAVAPEYETVLTQSAFEDWIARIEAAPLVSIDTETTSLDPMLARIVGISLAIEPGRGCYVPLAHHYAGAPAQLDRDAVLARVGPWLEDPRRLKVGQHLKNDQHGFANHGITLRGVAHDTLLQSYVLEAHRNHNMDALAERHLGR